MRLRRKDIPYVVTMCLLLVLIVLGSIHWGSRRRPRATTGAEQREDPAQAVFDMVEFQSRGDADRYIGCFVGRLRDKIRRDAEEMGPDEFRRYLRETGAAIKGVAAVGEPDVVGPNATVNVEFVYEGKFYQTQQFTLRRSGRRWRIYSMSPRRSKRAPVEYGTPAQPVSPIQAPDDSLQDQRATQEAP